MGIILSESSTMITNDESEAKNKKEEEYIDYIKEHVNNVCTAFNNYFLTKSSQFAFEVLVNFTFFELESAIKELSKGRIYEHDNSKYSDEEFEPYRAKYFPTEKESTGLSDESKSLIEKEAGLAWIHHYRNNPHHPKYWVDEESNIPKDMDLISIIEMICDWEAMSMKFNGSTLEWYNNKAKDEKACMTDKTKNTVEEIMSIIYKK